MIGLCISREVNGMNINWNKGKFGIHSADFDFLNRPKPQKFGYNYPSTLPPARDVVKSNPREITEEERKLNKFGQGKY